MYVPVSDITQLQQIVVPANVFSEGDDKTAVSVKSAKKRGNRGSRKPKASLQTSSRNSVHSSSDDSSSSGRSTPNATPRRPSCVVQTEQKELVSSSVQSSEKGVSAKMCSLPVTSATLVASNAVLDWPNVWGELAACFPVGFILQLTLILAPLRSSLLYYQVEVNRSPAIAMFDTGASQSFITYDLVD